MRENGTRTGGASKRAALAVQFWYRQSPAPIAPSITGTIQREMPPLYYEGEVAVQVDAEGRLRILTAIPPQGKPSGDAPAADWSSLFQSAGLDIATWKPVPPQRNPVSYADDQAAWEGSLPEAPELPVRIEAAAYRGRPVSFRVLYAWSPEERKPVAAAGRPVLRNLVLLGIISGAFLLARRNLRLGRGDRRGALRLALTVFAAVVVILILGASDWLDTPVIGVGMALLAGTLVWTAYIALEPILRRRQPHMLVSWTRFLAGEWRDPLLGRDLLAGCAAGVVAASFFPIGTALPAWLNGSDAFYSPSLDSLNGTGMLVAGLIRPMAVGTMVILARLMIYVLALAILRRSSLAILAYLLIPPFQVLNAESAVGALSSFFAMGVLPLVVLLRFGLLGGLTAGVVMGFFFNPLTFRSVWYAPVTYVVLFLVAAIALYGFKTSIGGRRLIEIADT